MDIRCQCSWGVGAEGEKREVARKGHAASRAWRLTMPWKEMQNILVPQYL